MSKILQTTSRTIRNTKFSYSIVGDGIQIVILHGNPGSKADFKNFSEALAGKGYRVIAIDRPGHGSTEELLPDTQNEVWNDADVYIEFIKRVCGGKAYIIGYSLGAFLALKIAIRQSDAVMGLGLISPYVVPNNPSEGLSKIPELAQNPFLGTILGLILPILASSTMRNHLIDEYYPSQIPGQILEEKLTKFCTFERIVAIKKDSNNLLRFKEEVYKNLNKIKIPVIIITGDQDKKCRPSEQVGKILSGIPHGEKCSVPDGGHGIPFTHLEKVASYIDEHIKKCNQ